MSIRDESLYIGHVSSVDGASITVEASKLRVCVDEKDTHITVGSFVNCAGNHGDVLCVVTRAWQELGQRLNPENNNQPQYQEINKVELVVVGTISEGFERGVDQLPPVNADAYFITGNSFDNLLEMSLDDESKARLFPVGQRVGTGDGEARFDLDKFFGRHAAVLGTTGSGKSYTLAALAQAVLRSYAQPRLVIFDIHNEYGEAFRGEFSNRSNCIEWPNFRLPFWMLSFEEFTDVLIGGKLGSVQKPFLEGHLLTAKRSSAANPFSSGDHRISVDTPIPFSWGDFIGGIESALADMTTAQQKDLPGMLSKLKTRANDPRFSFLFESPDSTGELHLFFEQLFGVGDLDTHITILDLSGLPAEVRSTAIGIICRMFFDYRYWDSNSENLPVALVLEEAHSYIPAQPDPKCAMAVKSIERIAKEGRKYGLSLVVVSQRPANVSTTILSQCGTFVALRLTSDVDQSHVIRLLPDTLGNQGSLLSSLRDGEGVVSGDGVTLPGRVYFQMPSPTPGSSDVRYHISWRDGPPEGYSAREVVDRWLDQTRD